MQVFTHYPALAFPIKRAGYEPVLLRPFELPPGPVKVIRIDTEEVMIDDPRQRVGDALVVKVLSE